MPPTAEPPILTVRHRYVLKTLAAEPTAFYRRDLLRGIGDRTLADLARREFIDSAGSRHRSHSTRYRITAAELDWLAERERAKVRVEALRSRRRGPKPIGPHPIAVAITANVSRLAAERDLTVEEVARRAGLRTNALSPVPSGFSIRVLGAVAKVLGVEASDLARR